MFNIETMLKRVYESRIPERGDLERLLSADDEDETRTIYGFADEVRRTFMGDGILVRGIVEFSNVCRNTCHYCGLNRNNRALERFRLKKDEILMSVRDMAQRGIKTVVLQSGEDDELDPEWLQDIIREIKDEFGIAVTLSAGERTRREYEIWREAGADRYLLKIETSDKVLYESLHEGMSFENRLRCLRDLRDLGYQTGSGIIVGLRGQKIASLADDILFFKEHDFDMIGIGPFIPHAKTPLAADCHGDANMTLKMIALTRIVTKDAHIPATTALGSLEKDFRIDALKAGANVLMPNFTPKDYKKLYEIYPGKRCVGESGDLCVSCVEAMVDSIGRTINYGRGDSLKRDYAHTEVNGGYRQ